MNALDRIDYQIVRLLRNNARLTNKEIAAQVGLAPSTCLVRTRLLQQAGVITGFKAEVNPTKGRFRSFLLAAMNHFLSDAWDKARAQKRGAERVISVNFAELETQLAQMSTMWQLSALSMLPLRAFGDPIHFRVLFSDSTEKQTVNILENTVKDGNEMEY